MPLAKNKWRRSIAVRLCAMLIFSTAFSVTAFADNAVVTSGSMYSYFQTFSSKGQWVDVMTPSHWITDTGEVAYCLQTSKDSPYNSGYHTVEGSDYYDQRTLTGLYAILENGYPVTTGGFTDEQARYATANAIRFWCAENYCEGMPQYLNLNVNGDWIRGKYGYQIISTLPSITSAASYLTDYTFIDTLSKGITYNKGDVLLEFFKDESCTDLVASWAEPSDRFLVSYNTTSDGASVMTISVTASGLAEINSGRQVYVKSSMVNSGYSDCTLRITYKATVNSDGSVTYGDAGNPNDVVLTWKRTNSAYYDTLVDDCHIYVYGIDMTKQFSDGRGDFSKVQFIVHNDTDNYYLVGKLNEAEGIWYVTDHVTEEKDATHFIPTKDGKLILKGLEDDTYTWTEVQTANGYTLLKNSIKVVISQTESETLCAIYGTDILGLIQNDPRYADVDPGLYHNMPQRHLEHKLLTASATVDNNKVNMEPDGNSANAFVPFTVINTRGFDLPQTGSYGNWMFPVAGLSMSTLCVAGIVALTRKNKKKAQNT